MHLPKIPSHGGYGFLEGLGAGSCLKGEHGTTPHPVLDPQGKGPREAKRFG